MLQAGCQGGGGDALRITKLLTHDGCLDGGSPHVGPPWACSTLRSAGQTSDDLRARSRS